MFTMQESIIRTKLLVSSFMCIFLVIASIYATFFNKQENSQFTALLVIFIAFVFWVKWTEHFVAIENSKKGKDKNEN